MRRTEQLQPDPTTVAGMARVQTNEYQLRPNQILRSPSNGNSIAMQRSSTNSNLGVTRTSSNSNSQPQIAKSSSNLNGIARSSSNLVSTSSSNSSGFGAARTPTSLNKPPNAVSAQSPHTLDQNQRTRLRIPTGPSSQLQSLSEVEEMDVRPEEDHGPPRYSHLFPESQVCLLTYLQHCYDGLKLSK